jgi:hypothetical protein
MNLCLIYHYITGHLVFVLVSTEGVMMCPMIYNLASCKVHAVIHLFFTLKVWVLLKFIVNYAWITAKM